MDNQPTSRSRLRPRISLLTAILLTTIVGLSIVTVRLWREVEPLRAQLRIMRTDLGLLNLDVPDRASAIQLTTLEEGYWRWRVYLPLGRKYHLRSYSGKRVGPIHLPYQDEQWYDVVRKSSTGGSKPCGPGEFIVETKIVYEDGKWCLRTAQGGAWITGYIDGDWAKHEMPFGHSPVVEFRRQSDFQEDERILLLLMRRSEREMSGDEVGMWDGGEPTDGLVVWIEAEPDSGIKRPNR